ncbi:hypothetical protein E2C01_046212 [Portunus trituberculatus]|uniref:Uncharacterized protein n=1 Tax=Portunus trituberculatus TaxID=210409 RepID=A0A5B7G4F8_PORTR|nr:hypothetical protein [Portunus trituberculatus]
MKKARRGMELSFQIQLDQYQCGRLWRKKALLVPQKRSVLAAKANTLSGWHDSVRLAKVREGKGRGEGGGREARLMTLIFPICRGEDVRDQRGKPIGQNLLDTI